MRGKTSPKRSPDDFDSRLFRHRNDTNPRRLRHRGGVDFTPKTMLRSKRARSLMVLIVFMTAVPLAAALWLGWQLLERDRVLEDQRMQERVDLAAGLASCHLAKRYRFFRTTLDAGRNELA